MKPVYGLGVFIPIAVVLRLADAAPSLVFATSALGIVPVAALMGEATEQLATRSGPGIGGLVNVTFGNAPESMGCRRSSRRRWSARSWATRCWC